MQTDPDITDASDVKSDVLLARSLRIRRLEPGVSLAQPSQFSYIAIMHTLANAS